MTRSTILPTTAGTSIECRLSCPTPAACVHILVLRYQHSLPWRLCMPSAVFDRSSAMSATTPAERLRLTTAAVRVALKWLGVRKALTPAQRSQAAEAFHAEGEFLSARKK